MADLIPGGKKIGIDRNQRTAMIAVGLAVFVLVFSIFFGLRLWSKQQYQTQVINSLECARKDIRSSRDNLNSLKSEFDKFNSGDAVLGDKQDDIKNSVIALRALPAEYLKSEVQLFWDRFLQEGRGTGLGAEMGKPGTGDGYKGGFSFPSTSEITGGEGAGAGQQEILFSMQVEVGSQEEMDKLFEDLHNFIMPVKILGLQVTFIDPDISDGGYANLDLRLKTYVQGEQSLNISTDSLKEGAGGGGGC